MTTSTSKAKAPGANAKPQSKSNAATATAPAKNEEPKAEEKPPIPMRVEDKVAELEKQRLYFEKLSSKVKARNVLLAHHVQVKKCLNNPDLAEALEDEDEQDSPAEIRIYFDNHNYYTIKNANLIDGTLRYLDGQFKQKITEVEADILG